MRGPLKPNIGTNMFSTVRMAFTMLIPAVSSYAMPITGIAAKAMANASSKKEPLTEGQYWTYAITSVVLVTLGGVFAGLTLGLMGQDEVNLKVISQSGTPSEKRDANTVLNLLSKGKHWLLVTLLLSNVVTNETLPVILDRFLGGGAAAVLGSTVLIVIFGEIIPQSVCVRYGLQIGAFFCPFVKVLMYVMYPVAYPIAKLLDWSLGQDHGTLYGKSGLKTLVNLHHTMGVERLSQDEVTIISAVLDLKDKAVGEVMTPLKKVFTLPSDTILDEATVEEIFNAGFSRIPIHIPGEPTNFVGMLLVRILISYDPEDALPVSAFPLATLPETGYYTSCLNILNYFQEGKSHMVVVSESPGKDTGAKGVVTLEDVIEELIGEEIVDESDVYVDVDRNIKRQIPGPLAKRNIVHYLHDLYNGGHENGSSPSSASPQPGEGSSNDSPYILKSDFEQNKNNSKANLADEAGETSPFLSPDLQSTRSPVLGSRSPAMDPLATMDSLTLPKGIKPSNLAANPLHTNNKHITIKKPQQLQSPSVTNPPSRKVSMSDKLPNNMYAIKADARARLTDRGYGSAETSRSGSVPPSVPPSPPRESTSERPTVKIQQGVFDSEVGAFVKGVKENEERRKSKDKDHVPLPLGTTSFGNDSNSSDGIVENNIITDSGFHRTVIEENPSSDEEETGGAASEGSSKMSISQRIRRDSKRLFKWSESKDSVNDHTHHHHHSDN